MVVKPLASLYTGAMHCGHALTRVPLYRQGWAVRVPRFA
jgi:hypothetical protein